MLTDAIKSSFMKHDGDAAYEQFNTEQKDFIQRKFTAINLRDMVGDYILAQNAGSGEVEEGYFSIEIEEQELDLSKYFVEGGLPWEALGISYTVKATSSCNRHNGLFITETPDEVRLPKSVVADWMLRTLFNLEKAPGEHLAPLTINHEDRPAKGFHARVFAEDLITELAGSKCRKFAGADIVRKSLSPQQHEAAYVSKEDLKELANSEDFVINTPE